MRRFESDAWAVAWLNHPNIAAIGTRNPVGLLPVDTIIDYVRQSKASATPAQAACPPITPTLSTALINARPA
jgi:hypothetical protein